MAQLICLPGQYVSDGKNKTDVKIENPAENLKHVSQNRRDPKTEFYPTNDRPWSKTRAQPIGYEVYVCHISIQPMSQENKTEKSTVGRQNPETELCFMNDRPGKKMVAQSMGLSGHMAQSHGSLIAPTTQTYRTTELHTAENHESLSVEKIYSNHNNRPK